MLNNNPLFFLFPEGWILDIYKSVLGVRLADVRELDFLAVYLGRRDI